MRLALQVVSVVVFLLASWLWWRASQQPPHRAFVLPNYPNPMTLDPGFRGGPKRVMSLEANRSMCRFTDALAEPSILPPVGARRHRGGALVLVGEAAGDCA